MRRVLTMALPAALLLAVFPGVAQAHVKWFAPYIVDAPPLPVIAILTNTYFWTGIGLVLFFFVVTRCVEAWRFGSTILDGLDNLTNPLWNRLDDFVRATIAVFFIAIFAVGGVYLTPDLKTPSEFISWIQFLIAVCIFFRATMPFAALGIIALWMLALRDYDFFHLLDYLALGLGTAAYLILTSMAGESWRKHRFQVLRWAVAISLMWSSLEKFAYPEWFYPLVLEKPFLTFGLPRDVFIPMAGVAEFTLGFGLLWTPLIRRLSAIALLLIFNAAVYPFGRLDLIGHALIMAMVISIAADHSRDGASFPAIPPTLHMIPVTLAGALIVFSISYWGMHATIYAGQQRAADSNITTHSADPENPHINSGQ